MGEDDRVSVEGAKLPHSSKPTRIVISGCSGGGKSTLLDELARRGHRAFTEPGREIVKSELASGGDALPWKNVQRFAERCIAHAIEQLKASEKDTLAFFDRSIIDAVSALKHLNLTVPDAARRTLEQRPYAHHVFMAPPWPELFAADSERRHSFEESKSEFERLLVSYKNLGHQTVLIPRRSVAERADFILGAIEKTRECKSE